MRVRMAAGVAVFCAVAGTVFAGPREDAQAFQKAIASVNDAHARNPGKTTESDLSRRLSASALAALKRVLEAPPSPETAEALTICGLAALDLDLADSFGKVRARLAEVGPAEPDTLGIVVSRPRAIIRGTNGLSAEYLETFATVLDAVLDGYDEVFGFQEWSKVPGKKLRVLVHLEPEIVRPPHFAPEFPWHSQIDFPVNDPTGFHSPTKQGQFLLYGLCHELGHVIAMWGDQKTMEDHHAWAHYTGVTIVDHLAAKSAGKPSLLPLRDAKWRSLRIEESLPANQVDPGLSSQPAVMALLLRLHREAGPKSIGAAVNLLDSRNRARRINRVRYYSFGDFRKALTSVIPERPKAKAVEALFRD